MATQVKITFNSDGFRQLLLSDGVKQLVESTTEQIRSRAEANLNENQGEARSHVWQGKYGGGRWVGSVSVLETAESEDKALTKAVK